MVWGTEKNPRRGRETRWDPGQLRGYDGESLALTLVEGVPGAVGASDVAHHRAPREGRRVPDDGSKLTRIETEPCHPGVNVEDRWGPPRCGPPGDLPWLVQR